MKIAGIDPGTGGAIALIEKTAPGAAGKFIDVIDMPTLERDRTGRTPRLVVNGAAIAKVLKQWAPDQVFLEKVDALPPRAHASRRDKGTAAIAKTALSAATIKTMVKSGEIPCPTCDQRGGSMGATSAFNFGNSSGIVEGVVAALEISIVLLRPGDWKKIVGLTGAKKGASRTLAQRIFPSAPLELVKHDGRAEALLIAYAGSRAQW